MNLIRWLWIGWGEENYQPVSVPGPQSDNISTLCSTPLVWSRAWWLPYLRRWKLRCRADALTALLLMCVCLCQPVLHHSSGNFVSLFPPQSFNTFSMGFTLFDDHLEHCPRACYICPHAVKHFMLQKQFSGLRQNFHVFFQPFELPSPILIPQSNSYVLGPQGHHTKVTQGQVKDSVGQFSLLTARPLTCHCSCII